MYIFRVRESVSHRERRGGGGLLERYLLERYLLERYLLERGCTVYLLERRVNIKREGYF